MAVRTITVRVTGDVANFHNAMRGVEAQIVKTERVAASTTKVFHQMRGGMASLAQAAIGQAVPGLTSLSGVLGSFAVGSTATVAVLGGIAAVAGAYRLLSRDAREAADNVRKAMEDLLRPTAAEQLKNNIETIRIEVEKLQRQLEKPISPSLAASPLGAILGFFRGRKEERLAQGIQALGRGEARAAAEAVERTAKAQQDAARAAAEWARTLAEADAIIRRMFQTIVKIRNPFEGRPALTQLPSGEFIMSNTPRPIGRGVTPILGGSRFEGAISGRARTAEQLENEARRLQAAADSMAQSVAIAFESWVTGAQKAKDAIRDMVNSILRDLLRLIAQRAIVEPLAGIFLGAIGGGISGSRTVVHQQINFGFTSLDPRTHADLIRQQAGTIAEVVGDAARRSTGFRAQLVHG